MSAFNTDDCVDNRLPLWSGKMLKQLKTLLNTPGKTYDDLMADPNWPVWMFDYEMMKAGEKVTKTAAMKAAKNMGGKANGWQKKKFIPPSPEKEKNPKEMTKAELLALVEKLEAKIQELTPKDDEDDEEGSGDDAPAEEHKDT